MAPASLRISIITGFFLPVPAVSGGATEKAWHGLAQVFAAAGHEVTLVSRRWPTMPNDETVGGVRYIRVNGFNHSRFLPVNVFLDLIWGLRVARRLPDGDVVVCNTLTLPVWLRRAKPAVGTVTVMIGRAPKGQVPLYGGVKRIYSPSSYISAQMGSAQARTLSTGYPIDWPLLARSAGQAGNPVVIGYVGRLHPEKGVGLLLKAAALLADRPELPPWILRFVGPSSVAEGGGGEAWLDRVKAGAAPALAGRVEWQPAEFDPQRLARIYGQLDIFCYPSLAESGETFGVGVAEAMAAGAAAVVSALGCFGDIVRPEATGLIFDHRRPDAAAALAASLGRLLEDPPLRGRLAAAGREHVRRFDIAAISDLILSDLRTFGPAGA